MVNMAGMASIAFCSDGMASMAISLVRMMIGKMVCDGVDSFAQFLLIAVHRDDRYADRFPILDGVGGAAPPTYLNKLSQTISNLYSQHSLLQIGIVSCELCSFALRALRHLEKRAIPYKKNTLYRDGPF